MTMAIVLYYLHLFALMSGPPLAYWGAGGWAAAGRLLLK